MDQTDLEETPRPKRRRGIQQPPDLAAPPSPTKSDTTNASNSDIQSHNSGRLSTIKQMGLLEDLEKPVIFCNFDDEEEEEPADVTNMRAAIQRYADGIGILAFEGVLDGAIQLLGPFVEMDRIRLQYPWANDPYARSTFGSMPLMQDVRDIVNKARQYDRDTGSSEDDWNSNVHLRLLELSLKTSKQSKNLSIHSV